MAYSHDLCFLIGYLTIRTTGSNYSRVMRPSSAKVNILRAVLLLLSACAYARSEEAGTGLAVAALWLLDLAMNASLVALRAIVADCAPRRQQVYAAECGCRYGAVRR